MAQHDFVPAWLNFSTPQSSKSSSSIVEKHGEHLPRGEGRLGVSRRRHNSSDGFFNNGPLRTSGDSWHQPSLLRHDSVDSGVSKSSNGAQPGWHGASRGPDSAAQRGGGSCINGAGNGSHRNRNGSVLSRKNASMQDKQPAETREEKNAERKKLQFEEEDFPSLNSETSKQTQNKQTGAPSGVWENPPSAKQPLKVLVIKKLSRDDPSAFSAAFASPGPHLSNGGSKTIASGPIVYKNLLPKPAVSSVKSGPWKSSSRDSKSGSFSNRDSAFTSPVLATKPAVQAPAPLFISPKEGTASVTPPLELGISRLTRMTRRVPDKKSEFLKALKDEQDADPTEDRDSDKLEEVQSPSDLNDLEGEHVDDTVHHNGLTTSQEERTKRFPYSLEAEHRLLKEMGWQESPENDEDYLPLTEEELHEFHVKFQQRRQNGMGQNGFLRQPRRCALLFASRGPLTPNPSECSDTDTSSTDTSDDES